MDWGHMFATLLVNVALAVSVHSGPKILTLAEIEQPAEFLGAESSGVPLLGAQRSRAAIPWSILFPLHAVLGDFLTPLSAESRPFLSNGFREL